MAILFAVLLDKDLLEDDIDILKEHLEDREFSNIVFFIRKKNGKTRTLLTKNFEKLVDTLEFEEYDEFSLEDIIQSYTEESNIDYYEIVLSGLTSDIFQEEEPIQIEEL